MKKSLIFLLICTLFAACGDSDEESLTLSETSCILDNENSYAIIDIINGNGDYRIMFEDPNIVQCKIENNKIYLFGINEGTNTIIIVEQEGRKQGEIKVTVSESISRPTSITEKIYIKKGDTKEIKTPTIYEFDSYGVDDDGGMVSVSETNTGIRIKGEKIGKASVYLIKNMWPVHMYDIDVLEKYQLTINTRNFTISQGMTFGVYIIMGNGNYRAESSDNSVAVSTSISEYTGEYSNILSNPATVWIETLSTGIATITITDEEGETEDIILNVN